MHGKKIILYAVDWYDLLIFCVKLSQVLLCYTLGVKECLLNPGKVQNTTGINLTFFFFSHTNFPPPPPLPLRGAFYNYSPKWEKFNYFWSFSAYVTFWFYFLFHYIRWQMRLITEMSTTHSQTWKAMRQIHLLSHIKVSRIKRNREKGSHINLRLFFATNPAGRFVNPFLF